MYLEVCSRFHAARMDKYMLAIFPFLTATSHVYNVPIPGVVL